MRHRTVGVTERAPIRGPSPLELFTSALNKINSQPLSPQPTTVLLHYWTTYNQHDYLQLSTIIDQNMLTIILAHTRANGPDQLHISPTIVDAGMLETLRYAGVVPDKDVIYLLPACICSPIFELLLITNTTSPPDGQRLVICYYYVRPPTMTTMDERHGIQWLVSSFASQDEQKRRNRRQPLQDKQGLE